MNFYKYRDSNSNAKVLINKDEALELAKKFIAKINPDKAKQVELIETNATKDNEQYYGFNFIRKIDDIYVESDYISIGVDAVNNDINLYSMTWYKGEDNSYAKEKIMKLAQYGIGFSGNKFNPKDVINQEDFLYLLLRFQVYMLIYLLMGKI